MPPTAVAEQSAPAQVIPGATVVSKLTVKTMGTTPAKVASAESGRHNLARIYGKVSDLKYSEDTKSPGSFHCAFKGVFEGVNLENGEVFQSGLLYLPKGISEMMEEQFKRLAKDAKNDATIEFALEIRSVKATNPIGYSYEAQALHRTERVDELAELRKLMTALPAKGLTVGTGKHGKELEAENKKK